ncbi:heterocyst frequency control protein PatD [Spirulina major]|uniref:heterocyst frequency control protein PatD n=1 Tax=Spirulina major TaxID=270636 RepID=UPI001114ED53|nr:heterocyst frequency control protein PatD [Spirulina major]
MPSPLNCEQYAAIAKPLLDLRKFLTLPEQSVSMAQKRFVVIKQVYQTTILRLDLERLDPQSRSIVTELHRLIRLLETQLMFLKSARTEAAIALRQQQTLEHLNHFIQLLEQFDPARS